MSIYPSGYQPWFKIGENGGKWDISRQDAGLNQIDFKGKTVLEIGCKTSSGAPSSAMASNFANGPWKLRDQLLASWA